MGISQQQALDCLYSDDLIGIGMEADAVRRGLHPDGVVTYTADREVAIDQPPDAFEQQIDAAIAEGATVVCLVSGRVERSTLKKVQAAFELVRRRSSRLRIHALSATEILSLAEEPGVGMEGALQRLASAGLDSFSGDTGGVDSERWLEVHRSAHRHGIRSTASMIFGKGETVEERVDWLFALRALQEETSGFAAFSATGFKPETGRAEFEEPTTVEYLRTVAVARMVLDNLGNIESSAIAQGLKVMQMALRFGANDGGALPRPGAGAFTEADLRRVVRDAGFTPVERDTTYRTMFLGN